MLLTIFASQVSGSLTLASPDTWLAKMVAHMSRVTRVCKALLHQHFGSEKINHTEVYSTVHNQY